MTAKTVQEAAVAADARFAAAHRALVGDKSIQFDLPHYVPPKPPSWLEPLLRFFTWSAPAFPYIFWTAVVLAVLAIVYLVVSNLAGFEWLRRRRKVENIEAEDWRPEEGVARALLAEAETLAAQGRYAEAARLLLQRSVEDIARRLPLFMKPSLTARDIAGADALPAKARPAFSAIAHVVEVSAFGAQAVTAAAWDECRAAYVRFATPKAWANG